MNTEQQELYEKLLKKVNEYCLGQAAEDVIAAIDALVESYETPKVDPTSKTSKALDNIIETFIDKDSEDIKTVRTALKALEIIKEYFEIDDFQDFISLNGRFYKKLHKEEYDLLKEVLK